MPSLTLAAQTRTKTKKAAKGLLSAGRIPAVVYGRGVKSRPIEVDAGQFQKIFKSAGESTLVDLSVDRLHPIKVLIGEAQLDPLKNTVIHVDFRQVNMKEKIRTSIALKFTGEAPAVKGLGGTLIKNLDRVEVECLPGDLVPEIEVNIVPLEKFSDMIRVRDLHLPRGITVLEDSEEAVALVAAPRTDEELKALEEKVEAPVETVGLVEKKKKAEEAEAGEEAGAV